MISAVYLIILLVVMGWGLVIYINHQQKIRREDRRDHLQERREQLMEELLRSKKETAPDPDDELSDPPARV